MKARITLVIAAMAATLTACEQLPGAVNEAKREVRRNLIDPTSARFESVYENHKTGAVCGFVNAKNRMGAYVGAKPFVYEKSSGATLVQEPPTDREFERYFDNIEYAEAGDYMKLEEKCKSVALWQSKCSSSTYMGESKYCALVNDGKSMMDLYEAVKPNLSRY